MTRRRKTAGEELNQIAEELEWYKPDDPSPREQCPCCDYISLPERHEYLICPVCFWEDHGSHLDNADSISPQNHMTLKEGRDNFIKFGASSEKMLRHVVKDRSQFIHLPRTIE